MTFVYRKLYADILADDGTLGVLYLTWLHAWGLRVAAAGCEIYGADGRREVARARHGLAELAPESFARRWQIGLDLAGGRLTADYRSTIDPWSPEGLAPGDGFRWQVLSPRAETAWRWSGGARRRDLHGLGYVDWVELRRAPRWSDWRELIWGRAHPGEGAVVFSAMTFGSGRRWRRMARWAGGTSPVVSEEFACEWRAGAFHAEIPAVGNDARSRLVLVTKRVLHQGNALDPLRFPNALERAVAVTMAGRMRESRWMSTIMEPAGAEDAPRAVHEVVHFGRADLQGLVKGARPRETAGPIDGDHSAT